MAHLALKRVIGLMSGTSMDGIDAAWIETDGLRVSKFGPALSFPYAHGFQSRLRQFVASSPARTDARAAAIESELTDLHASAVRAIMRELGEQDPVCVDLVGFHGQTIWHKPAERDTWQLGDGQRLARALGLPVCFDFRSADIGAGGEGAPLAPLFHLAMVEKLQRPLVVLNLGGVANITWIGQGSIEDAERVDMVAFDTGPGNGLLDDWMLKRTGLSMDRDGATSARGRVDWGIVREIMKDEFFAVAPPKSLDRFAFSLKHVAHLSIEDGAATLAMLTANCVHQALSQCPEKPREMLVTGGGRLNATIMRFLGQTTGIAVRAIEEIGCSGDHLEAQAFAFLAVRTANGLPLTYPRTTGVPSPQTGGTLVRP